MSLCSKIAQKRRFSDMELWGPEQHANQRSRSLAGLAVSHHCIDLLNRFHELVPYVDESLRSHNLATSSEDQQYLSLLKTPKAELAPVSLDTTLSKETEKE